MRLIVARCSVEYSGRLSARLPEALRLVMLKADGSVLVRRSTLRRQSRPVARYCCQARLSHKSGAAAPAPNATQNEPF